MSSFAKSFRFLCSHDKKQFSLVVHLFVVRVLSLLRFIFSALSGGENCLSCGASCYAMPLCKNCAGLFLNSSMNLDNRCRICGKPLVSEIEICSVCRNSSTIKSVERIFPLQTYRLWKKHLLFNWKMAGKRTLSPFFAYSVEQKLLQIEKIAGKKLVVVPVPPRPGKIKKTGWDQISELCFYLSFLFGRKILPVLERHTSVEKKKMNRDQRLASIGKSYYPACEKKIIRECRKKTDGKLPSSVVLLDDLMTTGSTLEECAEILKKMGVERVFASTLFIVD